jgi:pimeloyl-ACP methyl ester carboxylesterase
MAIRSRRAVLSEVELEVSEAGEPGAPLVVLLHGFPELAYSWRHQMQPLADAGYHVIAPNQRGYGGSSAPTVVDAYGTDRLSADVVELIDQVGAEQAAVVGHDWGAMVAWDMARLHPERVSTVGALSVPIPVWPMAPIELMRAAFGDRFFYILYFQEVGPAEAELEQDPRRTMARILWSASGDAFKGMPAEMPPAEGTGFLTHMSDPPDPLPAWLSADDVDVYAEAFRQSGFFGPLSWYRNLDANHARVGPIGVGAISMPSWFIGGTKDPVLAMNPTAVDTMAGQLPAFLGGVLVEGAGHWMQQERPGEVTSAMLDFLRRALSGA